MKLNLNTLRRQLEFEISQLPHRQFIKDEHVTRWIDTILAVDPSRAMWHVRRLFQFGGSEIGPLRQSYRNLHAKTISEQAYAHLTDKQIFDFKFLISLPEAANAAMRRGSRFESVMNEVMREELSEKYSMVRERPDLVDRIVNADLDEFKWARVQVDQIWECDGKIILQDYKFPSEGGLKTLLYQEPIMYTSQVTIGKMIANAIGIQIDEVMVCPYDSLTDSFKNIVVEEDLEDEAEIAHVGKLYFDLMCEGKYPAPAIPKYKLTSSEEVPIDVKKAVLKATTLRMAATEIARELEKAEQEFSNFVSILESTHTDDMRISVATTNITGANRQKFNKAKAVELLLEAGVDEVEIHKIKNNMANLKKALKDAGIPKKRVDQECYDCNFEVDVSVSKDKKGEQANLVKAVKDEVSQSLHELTSSVGNLLIEYDAAASNDGSLQKRQSYQLKTLQRVINTAPSEDVQQKAESLLESRSSAYASNSQLKQPKPESQSEGSLVATPNKSESNSSMTLTESSLDQISHLFTNRL